MFLPSDDEDQDQPNDQGMVEELDAFLHVPRMVADNTFITRNENEREHFKLSLEKIVRANFEKNQLEKEDRIIDISLEPGPSSSTRTFEVSQGSAEISNETSPNRSAKIFDVDEEDDLANFAADARGMKRSESKTSVFIPFKPGGIKRELSLYQRYCVSNKRPKLEETNDMDTIPIYFKDSCNLSESRGENDKHQPNPTQSEPNHAAQYFIPVLHLSQRDVQPRCDEAHPNMAFIPLNVDSNWSCGFHVVRNVANPSHPTLSDRRDPKFQLHSTTPIINPQSEPLRHDDDAERDARPTKRSSYICKVFVYLILLIVLVVFLALIIDEPVDGIDEL